MFAALKRRWGPGICSWVPLELWHRLLKVELILPRYHMISDQDVPHVSGLYKFRNIRQFKADMEFFLQFYTPVSLQDVISHLDGIHRLPRRCVLLTFDDGFREMHDVVAPILHARGIPAVFFLTTAVIDNRELCCSAKESLLIRALALREEVPMKREVFQLLTDAGVKGPDLPSLICNMSYSKRHLLDELGAVLDCNFASYAASAQPYVTSAQVKHLMRQGFAIGAHSVDHPVYSELTIEDQLKQTRESLSWLSKRFQYECQAFAFPYRDTGVSAEYFRRAFADTHLKVSFGTGGVCGHFYPRNLERYTMEVPDMKASQILAREFAVTLLRKPFKPIKNNACRLQG